MSGKAALVMSVLFMGSTALLFAVFNTFFVGLYIDDVLVGGMAANLLLIAALFQLSDGVQCVSLGILRGINDTKMPTVFTVIAYWVVGIPIGWLLAKHFDLGLYGIWFGLSLGLTFSAVVLSIRFIKQSNEFDFVKDEQKHFKELIN